jgi:SAM-dependent methyltransferase
VTPDGAAGWDDYAPFYDWENAQTLGRRDLPFWRSVLARERGPILELGCGTGRLLMPLARAGLPMVGIDRSGPMLDRALARRRRMPRATRPAIVRGDIRALPFPPRRFGAVLAPYGMLQSLVRDRDFDGALADAARVLRRGGLLGVDLVPDLPRWEAYRRQVSLRGRTPDGAAVTLLESVRQDRRRRLTIFDEEFIERRAGREHRRCFTLTFRTLDMTDTIARLDAAGFRIEAMLGDYRGGAWNPRADVWVILARRR